MRISDWSSDVCSSDLLFERNGTTLLARAPVSFTTAALGGTIEVPGIDRKPCEIQIRPGVQHGNQIRLRGRGMPALNGRGIGDLVVQIAVVVPTKPSTRHRRNIGSGKEVSVRVKPDVPSKKKEKQK